MELSLCGGCIPLRTGGEFSLSGQHGAVSRKGLTSSQASTSFESFNPGHAAGMREDYRTSSGILRETFGPARA